MTRVYIASAYTKGDVGENIRRQIDAADALMSLGYVPYAPIPATHFQAIVHPRSYEDWMTQDFQWVAVCDVLLRLASESSGADREVKFAQEMGISVVYSIEELREKHPLPFVEVPPGECIAPNCECPPGVCIQQVPATFRRKRPQANHLTREEILSIARIHLTVEDTEAVTEFAAALLTAAGVAGTETKGGA